MSVTVSKSKASLPPLRVFPFSGKAETLTSLEQKIMEGVVQGRTIKEIGGMLNISPRTVKIHLGNSCRKLKSKTRAGAVVQFILRQSPTSFGLGSGPKVD